MGRWFDRISFAQVKSDHDYLQNTYGDSNDFCGSYCNTEKLFQVLDGSLTRKECYIEMIEYFFSNGIETSYSGTSSDVKPDENDLRVQRIKARYLID